MLRYRLCILLIAGSSTLAACAPSTTITDSTPYAALDLPPSRVRPFAGLWLTPGRVPTLLIQTGSPAKIFVLQEHEGEIENLDIQDGSLRFELVDPGGHTVSWHLELIEPRRRILAISRSVEGPPAPCRSCTGCRSYLELYRPLKYARAEMAPVLDDLEDAAERAFFDHVVRRLPEMRL